MYPANMTQPFGSGTILEPHLRTNLKIACVSFYFPVPAFTGLGQDQV